jgi:hypothetical protein
MGWLKFIYRAGLQIFSPVSQSFGEWLVASLSVCLCLSFRFPSVSEEKLDSHFNFVSQTTYWEYAQYYVQQIKLCLKSQTISGNLQKARSKFMIIPWWSFEVEKISTQK